MNDTLFGELTRRLDPAQAAATMQHNLQALLQGVAPALQLVNREEFEVQQALLARLRTQVDVLAQQVADLERALKITGAGDEPRTDS